MVYDWEHEGSPARVRRILERLEDGEMPDTVFGTHHRTDQLVEDLMDGSAYAVPDPAKRERARERREQAAFEAELRKYGLR